MASQICRSTSLVNICVQDIDILSSTEICFGKNSSKKKQVYVLGVTWFDTRFHKVYRSYNELITFCYLVQKKCQNYERCYKTKLPNPLPKIPARGFFDWSTSKLYSKHQDAFNTFLKSSIRLPPQVSRDGAVIDFFEQTDDDTLQRDLTSSQSMIFDYTKRLRKEEDRESGYFSTISTVSTPGSTYFFENDAFDNEIIQDTLVELSLDKDCHLADKNYGGSDIQWIESDEFTCGQHEFVGCKYEDDKKWIKECKEILLPYSSNKNYFVLVFFLERNDLECM